MAGAVSAAEFATAMMHCLAQGAPWPGAVAVSGGGDSKALMLLLAEWAATESRAAPVVLTVDHGLVRGSSRLAHEVVKGAKSRGLGAHRLAWRGEKPAADVEAAARQARYTLMGEWCVAHRIRGLYVAHTLEDQAETFVLRLARGSGLDGLAAMRVCSPYPMPGLEPLAVVRPLLQFEREALRGYLESKGEGWTEDPMNSDSRFARVRIRQAWPALTELGLSPVRIAAAAGHLARAREALESATAAFLDEACRFDDARAAIDGARLGAVTPEVGMRALAHVLSHISGEAYRPRFERLERLYSSIRDGTFKSARTLHGCRISRAWKDEAIFGSFTLVIAREPARRRFSAGVAHGSQIS